MVAYVRAQLAWLYIISTWDSKARGFGVAMDCSKALADQAFKDLLRIAYPSAHPTE